MKFSDSGLPQTSMIEEAFNYSRAHVMSGRNELVKEIEREFDMMRRQTLMAIEHKKGAGLMTEEEYKAGLENLKQVHERQMSQVSQIADRELDMIFSVRRLKPAQELAQHAAAQDPVAISAALLIDCVRSPLDFVRLQEKFGSNIATTVAQTVHVDAYPAERIENLTNFSKSSKSVYAALVVTNLDAIAERVNAVAKQTPAQTIVFPPGQEEHIFEGIERLWDNDKKLDKRLVDSFNKAAIAVKSVYRVEVDNAGKPELVKGTPPTPPNRNLPVVTTPPKNGKNNGGLGNDTF